MPTVPLVYMLIFGIYRIYQLQSPLQKPRHVPTRPRLWLHNLKFILHAFLLALSITYLVASIFASTVVAHQILSASIWTLMSLLAVRLQWLEDKVTRISSATLVVYWILAAVVLGFRLRTQSLIHEQEGDVMVLVGLSCALVVLALLIVLENLSKYPRKLGTAADGYESVSGGEEQSKECPEESANFWSLITFSWMNSIMVLGYKKPLTEDDLWDVNQEDYARTVSEEFERVWSEERRRHGSKPSLTRALFKAFGGPFSFAALFKLVQDGLQFTQPQLLNLLILFIGSQQSGRGTNSLPTEIGFLLASSMLLCGIIQSIMLHQYFHMCIRSGMHVRAALVTAIYKKALRLSNQSRQQSTVGEIVNLMSVDAQRMMDLSSYLHLLWSSPVQIVLAMVSLYRLMGPSVFAGVGVMVLMVPVNAYLALRSRKLQKSQMKNKDTRMKLMDEILNGIKVIKLYAWEKAFVDRVAQVRKSELDTLKSIGYLSAFQSLTWATTPFFVAFSTFAVYSFVSDEPLTASKVFVSISLFNLLSFPLSMFPMMISAVIEAQVALTRLRNFLLNEELDFDATVKEAGAVKNVMVEVQRGNFSWDPEETQILYEIDLDLKQKTLTAICGAVGSGKSSLIFAILGQMYRVNGVPPVKIRGTIAYVGQQAWIINATLKDNIVFGRPFNEDLYQKTVEACGLVPDIEMLPAGDATEIGERGINLSGGQKQRVSIARAVYAQSDIYLLDDPLSAVDAHVGRHIFDNVVGPKGLLRDKARLLVTHAIQYLPQCDEVIMMRGGRIIEGPQSFKDLMAMGERGNVFRLIKDYLTEHEAPLESEEAVDLEALGELAAATGVQLSSSSKSRSPSKMGKESSRPVSPAKERKQPLKMASEKPMSPKNSGPSGTLIEREHVEKGSVKKEVYRTYLNSVSHTAAYFALFMMIVGQGLQVSSNLWLKVWGAANERGEANNKLGLYLGVYGVIGLTFSAIVVAQNIVVWILCAIRSSRVLHNDLLSAVMRSPMSFFDTTPLGRIINRFAKDIYTLDEVLPRTFYSFFRTFINVLAIMLVISISTPLFLVMIVPMTLLYLSVQRYYVTTSRELKRLDSTSRSPIYAHFSETLGGVTTIRAFGDVDRFTKENEARLDANQRAYYPSVASNRWLAMRLELMGSLVIFGASLFAVIGAIVFKNVDAALAGLSISYALTVTQTLNWTVRQSSEIETNIVAVERISEYVKLPSEAPEVIETTRPSPEWPMRGAVEFRDVSLAYREGMENVLKNLTFSIKAGEKIGIVGRSGAGKSSTVLALFRLVEPRGTILIDGIDIASIGLYDLRSKLTIIPQDPVLFGGTLRENLDPFHGLSQNYDDHAAEGGPRT